MTSRVALLRGINVGGHHKLPMAQLRELAESVGLHNPTTYIQSGNLVFDATDDDDTVRHRLEVALAERYGFEIPVIVRSLSELEDVARSHPFRALGLGDTLLMVAFLDQEPGVAVADALDPDDFLPDRFAVSGRDVYLAYPNGSGRSKLTHNLLQRRLGVVATIRNRKTILRLIDIGRGPRS